jgi:hypothetical protein
MQWEETQEPAMTDSARHQIARRIHDLLLHEMGEDVDIHLMLGPPEYTRAVLSLCRACGSAELGWLADQFAQARSGSAGGEPPVMVAAATAPRR